MGLHDLSLKFCSCCFWAVPSETSCPGQVATPHSQQAARGLGTPWLSKEAGVPTADPATYGSCLQGSELSGSWWGQCLAWAHLGYL